MHNITAVDKGNSPYYCRDPKHWTYGSVCYACAERPGLPRQAFLRTLRSQKHNIIFNGSKTLGTPRYTQRTVLEMRRSSALRSCSARRDKSASITSSPGFADIGLLVACTTAGPCYIKNRGFTVGTFDDTVLQRFAKCKATPTSE